ncbi:MAG TPA: hypothetical protein VNW72_11165 [Chthoniobacterales bacterium]|jgi:hypothetical protein|nr:hypothetical protein [Chthoniobacterales bacterium]
MTENKFFTNTLVRRSIVLLKTKRVQDRRTIWVSSIGAAALVLIVDLIVPPAHQSSGVLLTVIGGIGALAFYLHRRHAEDARLVKELLTEFNERYDKLNNDLQLACWRDARFEEETKLLFIKYFNLCAEEWLFWRAGYIYEPVWEAWKNGMKQYSKDTRVITLWDKEAESDSYYGFNFRQVTS